MNLNTSETIYKVVTPTCTKEFLSHNHAQLFLESLQESERQKSSLQIVTVDGKHVLLG